MFTKQDDYTKRWIVYTAPFTPLVLDGKMRSFDTEREAQEFIKLAEKMVQRYCET